MIISGQIITRLSKKFKNILGKTGTVYSLSNVSVAPKEFGTTKYDVCLVEFNDGSRGSYQVAEGTSLSVGDKVKIVLRFGFEDERGLRFYLPKVIKIR